ISLKNHGHSTLGGRKVWYDPDVKRINYEEHGYSLGEFFDEDRILVVLKNGDFYITDFDANNHYPDNILRIEKWNQHKIWTAVLYDADNQGYPYIKRFTMDAIKRPQNILGDNPNSQLVLLTDTYYPLIKVTYGGNDSVRPDEELDAEQFIGVKGFKAKGKRITTWQIDSITELEPTRFNEEEYDTTADDEHENDEDEEENLDPDAGKSQQQIIDEQIGQLSLFPDDNENKDDKK
ncbi:MAG: DNA gyrase/topoisomerase IV subunit A, partial [Prevotella sp.]